MDGSASFGNLRVYPGEPPAADPPPPALPDPLVLAGRELIRPPADRRKPARGPEPFTAAWFDELDHKRYARHGGWLPGALEFGRHPGESLLVLGPGIGSDAAHYLRTGTPVTIAFSPDDHPDLVRGNLARHGLTARTVPLDGTHLPVPDGAFDVACWNALYQPAADVPGLAEELYRVLKAGGKVIALFPAKYDAGFWQDVLMPLQQFYWRRPADPAAAPKRTGRELRAVFGQFAEHRVKKRHLRRSEITHLWRVLPRVVLERLIGRVLVLKAFKPISAARTATHAALPADAKAA
jgi:SAM-dependent methyltransferase